MGTLKQSAPAASTTLMSSGGAVSNAAAAACSSANLDNATALGFSGAFRLTTNGFGSTTGIAGKTIDLYLVAELDGTNFPEVDASTPNLPADAYRGSFEIIDTNTTQYLDLEGIELGPFVYKAYIVNNSGQQLSAGWSLIGRTVTEQY